MFAAMHHHLVDDDNIVNDSYVWSPGKAAPFEELLVSWNATRPPQGHFSIYVSVHTKAWSPWLLYAQWGNGLQKAFAEKMDPVRLEQDLILSAGDGFQIKVVAENGADLSYLRSLHVCSSHPHELFKPFSPPAVSYRLDVQGLSQMALQDERKRRLCSPTSTAAVVRFLKNEDIDPIQFAEGCRDATFDIFGNWVFAVAEAAHQLSGTPYSCWAERLSGFQDILDSLARGLPVVISVRGPLPGSAQPYEKGHLLAVIGFDHTTCEAICMDPAFDTDDKTIVRYKLNDLVEAWGKRQNIAYVFQ